MKKSELEHDQISTGLRYLLTHPVVYQTYQRLIGIDLAFKKYINEIVKPDSKCRILDIGCGEGYILNFLPKDVTYVGYDLSPSYIAYAKAKYGGRGTFINERVREMVVDTDHLFDIVLATGLVHHLCDEESKELFKVGYSCLKPAGAMYTYDNCYYDGQSAISKYISSKDRGQHVRYPKQYYELGLSAFDQVEMIIKHNMSRIPQTVCILKCIKA